MLTVVVATNGDDGNVEVGHRVVFPLFPRALSTYGVEFTQTRTYTLGTCAVVPHHNPARAPATPGKRVGRRRKLIE